ncbi:SMU1112c/YaeR family gloxylase I-like metalloprotein [Streptococcus sp. DD12]|uniref:SMU1112c/YaeR family gloxylase I-like metalloprotein n=1 Tax=Streptococcus sp. DD12 TaxID=1777880 RepID=UPI000792F521|nr:VOC family protein [Streptococcus sp. DD12]KXT75622.1 hypothetical protein STRDD12_00734 [Streptococcus sp. DD12]
MRLETINHVAILVRDYAKSRDFYVNILGFDVLAEHRRPDRGDIKLDLVSGDIRLEIFGPDTEVDGAPIPPERPSYPEAAGLRHLAFTTADIEASREELLGQGVRVEPIRYDSFTGEKMTFFFDPDGLPLELHE